MAMSDMKIKFLKDGPILVDGEVELMDNTGRIIAGPQKGFALCRCGASAMKPFCDGAHSKVGFDGTLTVGNIE